MMAVPVRRNQASLNSSQWKKLVGAIDALHGTQARAPAYRAFVQVHVDAMSMAGMAWRVHTMTGMGVIGTNFLAWHRQFLVQLERRLQQIDATLTLPYWDWIADPELPPALSDPSKLSSWSVTRHYDPSQMPQATELDPILNVTNFAKFQRRLELGPHADVHVAIGGTMNSASSPSDPIFWLHHANLDRLWAQWQAQHPKNNPSNKTETLQPPPLFGVKVNTVLDIAALNYQYG
jgi:tyrosinase